MRRLILDIIPTDAEINGAKHQREGVMVRTVSGKRYSFFPGPIEELPEGRPVGHTGHVWLLNDRLNPVGESRDAVLVINTVKPDCHQATLCLLTDD